MEASDMLYFNTESWLSNQILFYAPLMGTRLQVLVSRGFTHTLYAHCLNYETSSLHKICVLEHSESEAECKGILAFISFNNCSTVSSMLFQL